MTGVALAAHEPALKIHGEYVRVRAYVESITTLSAHADYEAFPKWLGTMQGSPVRTLVTHGEPAAADALRRRIPERPHWPCEVPTYAQCVDLDEVESSNTQASAALSS